MKNTMMPAFVRRINKKPEEPRQFKDMSLLELEAEYAKCVKLATSANDQGDVDMYVMAAERAVRVDEFLKIQDEALLPPIYKSIDDMPIKNWFKIRDTKDMSWMLYDRADANKVDEAILEKYWNQLYDEWLNTFGVPERMKLVYEHKYEIFKLKHEMVLTEDRFLLTMVNLHIFELQRIYEEAEQEHAQNQVDEIACVDKYLRTQIDEEKTTVTRFYGYVQLMKQERAAAAVKAQE